MFSDNDEKMSNLVSLKEEYTQRVSKNVERLTKQIELLSAINHQIGGAPKKNKAAGSKKKGAAAAPAASKKKGAAAASGSKKSGAAGASPGAAGSPTSSEGPAGVLDFSDQQVSAALEKAQLLAAKESLSGDMAKKLADLQSQITALTKGDEIGAVVKEIVEKVKELKIPEVRALDKNALIALGKAADQFVKDGKTEDWEKATKAAKDSLAKATGSAGASPQKPAASGSKSAPKSGSKSAPKSKKKDVKKKTR